MNSFQGKFAGVQEKQSQTRLHSHENRLKFRNMLDTRAWIFIWIGLIFVGALAGCSSPAGENIPPAAEAVKDTMMPVENTPEPTSTQEPTKTIQPTVTPTTAATPTAEFDVGSTRISQTDGMELAFVPAGSFIMGDDGHTNEKPQHEVMLDAFWMDKYEVTNAQYQQCIDAAACDSPKSLEYLNVEMYQNHPVVFVNWFHADAYCDWAGRRLPSEAEWEKAARGPNGRVYPWGDARPTGELVNYQQEVDTGTSEVGNYPEGASYYGILDMAGNVYEWVNDWYEADYYTREMVWVNPQGPAEGTKKVLRGGSWVTTELGLRATNRDGFDAEGPSVSFMEEYFGFRCAVSAETQ